MYRIRKALAKTGTYQILNFASHLFLKRARTMEEYNRLRSGKYLRGWQRDILHRVRATDRK